MPHAIPHAHQDPGLSRLVGSRRKASWISPELLAVRALLAGCQRPGAHLARGSSSAPKSDDLSRCLAGEDGADALGRLPERVIEQVSVAMVVCGCVCPSSAPIIGSEKPALASKLA